MEEGIGRGGYRMLALMSLAIGILGLCSALYAFIEPTTSTFFNALGFVLSGFAMSALFVLALIVLGRAPRQPKAPAEPQVAGAPVATFTPRNIQVDFDEQAAADPQDEEEAPEPAQPAPGAPRTFTANPSAGPGRPRAAPADFARAAQVVGLEDSAIGRLPEPGNWAPPEQPRAPVIAPPKKRAGSGITLGEKRELERQGRLNRQIMAAEATPHEVAIPIPVARSVPPRAGVPTVVAKTAGGIQDGDWIPDGSTRGVCSKCKTVILAPQQRPLNLRCPRCDKVTLLQ